MSNQYQQALVKVHANLDKRLNEKIAALPKGFNSERFLMNAMQVVKTVKNLQQMDLTSVAQVFFKGALFDLDFALNECYAVAYGNQLNFQTDYKGEEKIVHKFAIRPVKDFITGVVREGDFIEYGHWDGAPHFTYRAKPFNEDSPPKGYFAVVYYKDGGLEYEVMSIAQCDEVRDRYAKRDKSGDFSPSWRKSPDEMRRKTVSRRLSKHIPCDFNKDQLEVLEEVSPFEFDDEEEYEGTREPVSMPEMTEEVELPKKKSAKKKEEKPADDLPATAEQIKQVEKLVTSATKLEDMDRQLFNDFLKLPPEKKTAKETQEWINILSKKGGE